VAEWVRQVVTNPWRQVETFTGTITIKDESGSELGDIEILRFIDDELKMVTFTSEKLMEIK